MYLFLMELTKITKGKVLAELFSVKTNNDDDINDQNKEHEKDSEKNPELSIPFEMEAELFWSIFEFYHYSSMETYLNQPGNISLRSFEIIQRRDEKLFKYLLPIQKDLMNQFINPKMILLHFYPIFKSLDFIIRIWDKAIASTGQYGEFQSCVCASIFLLFSSKIQLLKSVADIEKMLSDDLIWDQPKFNEWLISVCILAQEEGYYIKVSCYNI